MKDTAEPTDLCTCGHMRQSHARADNLAHGWPYDCRYCACDAFTKEALTIHDERAAANRRTP